MKERLGNKNQEIEIGTKSKVHHTPVALPHTATSTQAQDDYGKTPKLEKTAPQTPLVQKKQKKSTRKAELRSTTQWRLKTEADCLSPAPSQVQSPEFVATATLRQQQTTPISDDWILDEKIAAEIQQHLGTPDIDLFASAESSKARSHINKKQDAFNFKWSDNLYWINPPFNKYHKVVKKLKEDKSQAIVVFPLLRNEPWLQPILKHATTSLLLLPPVESNLFRNRTVKKRIKDLPTFDVLATRVDFSQQKPCIAYVCVCVLASTPSMSF